MPIRTATAVWEGSLRDGNGMVRAGNLESPYSFSSRFGDGDGTSPEELVAAAHAGSFSMALSGVLGRAGHTTNRIETEARVDFEKVSEGIDPEDGQQRVVFKITRITLTTRGDVPGIDEATFREHAEAARQNGPISQLLTEGAEVAVVAQLV